MQLTSGSWSSVPFQTAEELVMMLYRNLLRKKDLMFCSEGQPGTGKSTTTRNVFKWMCHVAGWDPDEKIVRIWDTDHLLQVMAEGQMFQLYELDEAVNIFHNQDWAKKDMKDITKVIRQMRIMRSCWGLNIPDFSGLHPHLRNDRIPLRFYHPPHWDLDGLGNGPSKMLWRQERFGYASGEVEHRWHDVGDFQSFCLDDQPGWQEYEQEKVANFKHLVQTIIDYRSESAAKAAKKPKTRAGGTSGPRKAANRPAPPTATQ